MNEDQPVARCASCGTGLHHGQTVIEGNLTHQITDEGVRTRRTFYCSQDCADAGT